MTSQMTDDVTASAIPPLLCLQSLPRCVSNPSPRCVCNPSPAASPIPPPAAFAIPPPLRLQSLPPLRLQSLPSLRLQSPPPLRLQSLPGYVCNPSPAAFSIPPPLRLQSLPHCACNPPTCVCNTAIISSSLSGPTVSATAFHYNGLQCTLRSSICDYSARLSPEGELYCRWGGGGLTTAA